MAEGLEQTFDFESLELAIEKRSFLTNRLDCRRLVTVTGIACPSERLGSLMRVINTGVSLYGFSYPQNRQSPNRKSQHQR